MKKCKLIAAAAAVLFLPLIVRADSPVTVHLDVETATTTLYDADITVTECAPAGAATSTSGYCALEQAGLNTVWSPYGDDYFLDSVSGAGNDYANNVYWGWFADLTYGQTALNKHALVSGERLLITLKNPLKLAVSTTTPAVGATTTVTAYEFGFDSSWNGVFLASASSTVYVDDASTTPDSNGHVSVVATSTDPITLFAVRDGFVKSPAITLRPQAAASAATTSPAETQTSSHSSSRDADSVPVTHNAPDASRMLSFLASKERADGSFGGIYTDWAAIACATVPDSSCAGKLAAYLKTAPSPGTRATDYERRAMALMSLNIDPYSGAGTDYIGKIAAAYDGTQIGDPSLVNDDIFAIFPLLSAGYSPSDPEIRGAVSFIVSKQEGDGSWEESVDLTSAAVQALSLTPSIESAAAAKSAARAFLASRQNSDGGWGSGYSTSWALQAIAALGEQASSWQKGTNNPLDYLFALEQSDGGMETADKGDDSRVWSTAYAIPATLGRTWGSLLRSFSKPAAPERRIVAEPAVTDSPAAATTTATTTIAIATTTQAVPVVPKIVVAAPLPIRKAIAAVSALKIAEATTAATTSVPAAVSNLAAAAAPAKTESPLVPVAVAVGGVSVGLGALFVFKFVI